MRYLAVLALLVAAPAFADHTVGAIAWDLYRGSTIVQPRLGL